jgi:hypothetical protein
VNIFRTFEIFLSNPLSIIQKRIIRILHVETNIFSKQIPMQVDLEKDMAQITVYDNQKVYKLLSNVLYKKKYLNENHHSQIYN